MRTPVRTNDPPREEVKHPVEKVLLAYPVGARMAGGAIFGTRLAKHVGVAVADFAVHAPAADATEHERPYRIGATRVRVRCVGTATAAGALANLGHLLCRQEDLSRDERLMRAAARPHPGFNRFMLAAGWAPTVQ